MTLKQVIENTSEIKPDAFSNETKTRWLNELEGRIQSEVYLFGPDNITTYTWEENQDTELYVQSPYDGIYEDYLIARIDLGNGEYDKYANSLAKFNENYTAFKVWFIQTYHPADRPCRGGCICEE